MSGVGKTNPPSPSSAAPKVPTPQPSSRKFYRYKSFWLVVAILIYSGTLSGASVLLNRRTIQDKAAVYLAARHGIHVEFTDLHFRLLWGEISGKDILLDSKRKNYQVSLNEFRLAFNPLWLLVGRLRLTSIDAKELFLDTSGMMAVDKSVKAPPPPDFLRRIKLRHARVENFAWKQKSQTMLMFARMDVDSKFGSLFVSSPAAMKIIGLAFTSPKIDVFVDEIEQNGFFVFDLTKPRFFDESRIHSNVAAQNVLLAFRKTHRYWLTDRGWDEDLDAVIERRYGLPIPKDRSYFFARQVKIGVEMIEGDIQLRECRVQVDERWLGLTAHWNRRRQDLELTLQTDSALKLSRLPLGQAKFRRAYEEFSIKTQITGKLKSLSENDLKITSDATLRGNLVNELSGNMKAHLEATLTNGILKTGNTVVDLDQGRLTATGTVDLKNKSLDVSFTTKSFDLKTVMRFLSAQNYPSFVDATGQVSGPFKYPDFTISFQSANAAYEFLNFGPAQGKLAIKSEVLDLDVSSNDTSSMSHLTLKIQNLYDSLHQEIDLKTTHENIAIAALLNSKTMDGTISGSFQLSRKNLETVGSGDFSVPQFFYYDHKIGAITAKTSLKNRHLSVSPLSVQVYDPQATVVSKTGIHFDFDDAGYVFQGSLGDFLKLSGTFKKDRRDFLALKLSTSKFPLHLAASLFPFKIGESTLTGEADLNYNLKAPILSSMKARLAQLKLAMSDGNLVLIQPTSVDYHDKAFWLSSAKLNFFSDKITLSGAVGMETNSALKVQGLLDFNGLSDLNPAVVDAEKPIQVDVTLKDDIRKPKLYGKAVLHQDAVTFRRLPGDLSRMSGTVNFEGSRISSNDLKLDYDDAPMSFVGWVETDWSTLTAASLKMQATDFLLHLPDSLDLVLDLDLQLSGASPLKLSGKANITEGEFKRNFGIANFILKPDTSRRGSPGNGNESKLRAVPGDMVYDIAVRNTGDFIVKNNVALIEMAADLNLVGTYATPALSGQIDFLSGTINAFGVNFTQATGSAQFFKKSGLNPVIDLTAKKSIQEYEIQAKMLGTTDNLKLSLDATPALDRREILSIIFYGKPPDELTRETRRQFTQAIAVSQLANILSQPVSNITGLDVFKVSSRQETVNETVQRLAVGKQVSNRFSLSFTTDLGTINPERAVELEFQILDGFYLIAAKDLGQTNRFRFDTNMRFELE